MSIRIGQPIGLLTRAERRDPSEAPEGPFLVVCYDATGGSDVGSEEEDDCNRFTEGRRFDRLCDAVASVVEGAGDIDSLIDALQWLEDGDDEEELLDELPFAALRARLVARVPELAPLEGLDYLSFALEGTLKFCTEESQSGYLRGVERAFPGWSFHIGWGAVPPLGDIGVAILVRRR